MSKSFSRAQNKNQKHPKVYFEQYLYNASEPIDDIYINSPGKLEYESLEDNYGMRKQLRHTAHRFRNRYS